MSDDIGKIIKTARENQGKTQDRLAKEIGVKQQTIAKWENENSITQKQLLRVCEVLELNYAELSELLSVKYATARPPVDLPLERLSPSNFERFCRDLLIYSGYDDARLYGVSGDKQDGVDIVTRNQEIAVQCKRYSKGFSKKNVQEVIDAYNAGGRQDKKKVLAITKNVNRDEIDTAHNNGWEIWGLAELTTEVKKA